MEAAKTTDKDSRQNQQERQSKLYEINKAIHDAESFVKVFPYVEREMLTLLKAERLTVYQRGRHEREIVSKYKTGKDIKEIRLALISPSSIAGFVALSQRPLRIDNVNDAQSLEQIHPQLNFDNSFDQLSGFRTLSMIVVPIKFKETLLGVLQFINRVGGGAFTDPDINVALEVAQVIGSKFQYDFQATQGPYEYLMHRKLLTPEKLEELKKKSAKDRLSIPQLLISDLNLVPEEIGESLERYYQVPFLKYDPDIQVPQDLIKNIKKSYMKSNLWVPVAFEQDRVTILIDDPNDFNRIMEIQKVLNARSYDVCVGIPEDILRYLGEGVSTVQESGSEVNLNDIVGKLENETTHDDGDIADTGVDENEATVVQLVNRLVIVASKINASDIHIEPSQGKNPAIVRMRVDGDCREMLKIPSTHIRAVIARIKIMSRLDISERRKPQDGKIGAKFHGKTIELRVATIPTVNGESAVLRVLAGGEKVLLFDKLNFTERNEREIIRLIKHPHGIFLVVGPTGSGKTTTLHAVLGHINSPDRKIWTAEDPVEITQPGLQQVQVQPQIGFTFAAALRAFLRADPDIILIGEMRDKETSHIGVEASLTGHLVFSTLHTNSAPETITRLLGLDLDPVDFADALLGVLAQRLLRTLCSECKAPYKPSPKEMEQLKHIYGHPTERFADEGMTSLMQDGIWKIMKGQSDIVQLRKVVAE